MNIVVTRVTQSGLFNGVVGIFASFEAVTDGVRAYEMKQREGNPHFPLTTLVDLNDAWPVRLHPENIHRHGECYIKGGLDDYHLSVVGAIGNPVGVPHPDPNAPGYTMKE